MNAGPASSPLEAVVIGASAGAVDALLQLLPGLPKHYPLPILVVVHLAPESDSTLVALLASRCQIAVKEAEDKEEIRAGTVYMAPPNYHLLVEPDFRLSLSNEEQVMYSRPSIDVLFESAAEAYGDALAGLVLTGANSDGAKGLHAICAMGGAAFVQTPESAEATAMPLAALAACPRATVLDLPGLAAMLKRDLVERLT